jgi:hypothetical protein
MAAGTLNMMLITGFRLRTMKTVAVVLATKLFVYVWRA